MFRVLKLQLNTYSNDFETNLWVRTPHIELKPTVSGEIKYLPFRFVITKYVKYGIHFLKSYVF